MKIRLAERADAAALVEFNQAMALETEGKTLDSQILQTGVAAVFDDEKKGFYVVAEENDEIIGGLMVTFEWSDWRNGFFWWIQSVYVLPTARRGGVFTTLFRHLERLAREDTQVCGLRLYVDRDNEAAHRTYRRLGLDVTDYALMEIEFDRPTKGEA